MFADVINAKDEKKAISLPKNFFVIRKCKKDRIRRERTVGNLTENSENPLNTFDESIKIQLKRGGFAK